jgi:putative restriction endonuclease
MEQKNEEGIFLRCCLFKREIPKIYNNTCCISGMRIDATISVLMVDACHIVPFSASYDDTVTRCHAIHKLTDKRLSPCVIISGRSRSFPGQYFSPFQ